MKDRVFAEYEVVGHRNYRGHTPGTRFVARHDHAAVRAINRRDIQVIREITPSLQPGSYSLPDGWPPPIEAGVQPPAHTTPRPAEAGLSHSGRE